MDSRQVDWRQVRRQNPRGDEEPLRLTWVRHGEYTSTALVDIGPGGGLGAHVHRHHDEVIAIVEGEVEFRLGDEVETLGEGRVISVGAGTIHAPVRSENGCVLISVFGGRFDPDNPDREFVDEI